MPGPSGIKRILITLVAAGVCMLASGCATPRGMTSLDTSPQNHVQSQARADAIAKTLAAAILEAPADKPLFILDQDHRDLALREALADKLVLSALASKGKKGIALEMGPDLQPEIDGLQKNPSYEDQFLLSLATMQTLLWVSDFSGQKTDLLATSHLIVRAGSKGMKVFAIDLKKDDLAANDIQDDHFSPDPRARQINERLAKKLNEALAKTDFDALTAAQPGLKAYEQVLFQKSVKKDIVAKTAKIFLQTLSPGERELLEKDHEARNEKILGPDARGDDRDRAKLLFALTSQAGIKQNEICIFMGVNHFDPDNPRSLAHLVGPGYVIALDSAESLKGDIGNPGATSSASVRIGPNGQRVVTAHLPKGTPKNGKTSFDSTL